MKLLFTITFMLLISSITSLGQPVTGAGTINYIPKFSTGPSVIGNSLIYDNGTNVGVGLTNAAVKFQVAGDIGAGNNSTARVFFRYGGVSTGGELNGMQNGVQMMAIGFNNDAVFSGTVGAVNGRTIYFYDRQLSLTRGGIDASGTWWFGSSSSKYGLRIDAQSATTTAMTITSTGNIGIATISPNANAKLDVNGNIYCNSKIYIGTPDANTATKIASYALAVNGIAIFTEAKVKLYANWPDFVFADKYNLLPLTELEKFLKKNKHLPNIPSAAEIAKNGLALGDMSSKLLEKIEELTLYMIDLKKENELLKKRLDAIELNKEK